jgi:cytochrome c oxidase subunit I+III
MVSLAFPDRDRLTRVWSPPASVIGRLSATQQSVVGLRMIVTGIVFLLIGGVLALLMRTQLAVAENDLISAKLFNELFTMHGTTMMFLFAVPIAEAFGNYMVPYMIGARDMAFPRATAFGYWCYLFGGILIYSSFFVGSVPDAGWTSYVPLAGPEFSGRGVDFWLLGTTFIEISTIAASIEIIVSILKLRAPGMSLNRMPVFAWALLTMAFMILIGFLPLIAGEILLEADRLLDTRFYDPAFGGNVLLWQHYFWFFGHPEVYVMLMPGLGIVSTIIVTFSRRPLIGYAWVVTAIVAIGFLSFGLWVHHMFTVGLPALSLSLFGAASLSIVIANGANIFSWISTIWHGRLVMKTPFLFVLGFFFIFIIGGITGAMVGVVPFDGQVHDTYFVVAHFHYVILGGVVFPIFGAFYYWFPHASGRMTSETLGTLVFWLMFIGANVTFFPMHLAGFNGMARRVYTYDADLGIQGYNFISTVGSFIFAAGVLLFVIDVIIALRRGPDSGVNPWGASTLEWATPLPPPAYQYRYTPIVRSRDPLWEQPELAASMEGEGPSDETVIGLGTARREGFATTLMDAIPDHIVVFAGTSLWPLVLGIATAAFFVGPLADLYILSVVAMPVGLIAIIAWNWPEREAVRGVPAGEEEMIRPLPVDVSDSRATGWWCMVLIVVSLAVIYGSIIAAYYYLAGNSSAWPPPEIERPEYVVPIIGAALALAAAAGMWFSVDGIKRDDRNRLLLGHGLGWLLGIASFGVAVYEFNRQDFDFDTHAYASSFLVILAVQIVQLAVAIIFSLVLIIWGFLGYYNDRRHLAVRNAALLWYYVAFAWLAVLVVLYASPHLLDIG